MSSTVERLLRAALDDHLEDEEETANRALGFVAAQAANAAEHQGRTWRNDPATAQALKIALPLVVDLLAQPDKGPREAHPLFKSPEEHAKMIFFWILNRLKERGNEYGTEWEPGHPLRNFPRAASALKFMIDKKQGDEQ
jgi:hypothetical protein